VLDCWLFCILAFAIPNLNFGLLSLFAGATGRLDNLLFTYSELFFFLLRGYLELFSIRCYVIFYSFAYAMDLELV
jgi:hypothetical protein